MDKEKIDELIVKYNAGVATPEEEQQIELLIGKGEINLESLEDLNVLYDSVMTFETPTPSTNLDHSFYQRLSLEKKSRKTFSWSSIFSWPEIAPKLAFASVALAAGIGIGYLINPVTPKQENGDMAVLTKEVADLKEMMMLSLLEKESASERLKAVSLTEDMGRASQKVTRALLETLNKDSNVNVRLAALDALKPYANDGNVREALIRSIAKQESPLVQLALAELMAGLQVKSSVDELKKIFDDDKTPTDIKKKIKESIDVLI
jgi:hypothetical protein